MITEKKATVYQLGQNEDNEDVYTPVVIDCLIQITQDRVANAGVLSIVDVCHIYAPLSTIIKVGDKVIEGEHSEPVEEIETYTIKSVEKLDTGGLKHIEAVAI